jgi:hypothetical protein
MKNLQKILLLIIISSFLITCNKKDRTLYFKSKEFRSLIGGWELQTIFVNGIDSTQQFMSDSTLADGWSFNFNIKEKKTEEFFFSCYYRGRRITKFCANCWYFSKEDNQLIITFILEKSQYEKLWQQNNKEVIFDIFYLSEYYMILKVKDLNNNNYELNFIKRRD